MEIRKAIADDAGRLSEIALAAKSYWRYPPRWLELWLEGLTITPEFIERHEVYVMTDGAAILGFYVVIINGKTAVLEHLWIDPVNINSGIGRQLFAHARQTAISSGAEKIEIESDPNAENFYLKMGARRIGNVETEIEGEERILPLMQIDLGG